MKTEFVLNDALTFIHAALVIFESFAKTERRENDRRAFWNACSRSSSGRVEIFGPKVDENVCASVCAGEIHVDTMTIAIGSCIHYSSWFAASFEQRHRRNCWMGHHMQCARITRFSLHGIVIQRSVLPGADTETMESFCCSSFANRAREIPSIFDKQFRRKLQNASSRVLKLYLTDESRQRCLSDARSTFSYGHAHRLRVTNTHAKRTLNVFIVNFVAKIQWKCG